MVPRIEREKRIIRSLRQLTQFLENRFRIFGLPFGYDAVIGLVFPGAGDLLTSLVSVYIVIQAGELGVSTWTLFRMLGNILRDFLSGLVPILGDYWDLRFRANTRNLEIIEEHLRQIGHPEALPALPAQNRLNS